MTTPDLVAGKLHHLPTMPGVYLMKDARGHVIYVGKAKVLRNRVQSYFHASQTDAKVIEMVGKIADLECIVTSNELEALILELNLIKKWRPRYNVMVKDDKHFPYIKITTQDNWPIIKVVRKIERDKASYFGPFVPTRAVWQTMQLIKKFFRIAHCKVNLDRVSARPCLSYQIKQCCAPCTRVVSEEEYQNIVNQVILFLQGRSDDLLNDLRERMEYFSEILEYEKAAMARDKLFSVKKLLEKQKIVSARLEDQDIIALKVTGKHYVVQVFHVRQGRLMGRSQQSFVLHKVTDEIELMSAFIKQFYRQDTMIPSEIVLQEPIDDQDLITEWLSQRRQGTVKITVPQRGRKLELVDMVSENVRQSIEMLFNEEVESRNAMVSLGKLLKMSEPPNRIECYDISNIQGKFPVGSMVVWEDGKLKSSEYRLFKVGTIETPNDYKMMEEVLSRRFTGSLADESKFPDLIVLDGGKGQLSIAERIMQECGFPDIQLLGIAKGPQRNRNDLFVPGRKNQLSVGSYLDAVYLLATIRDEAHRFAIEYHRKLRKDAQKKSILDEIQGVGPKRKKALLHHFKSLKRLKSASIEEINSVEGVNRKIAQTIHDFLQAQSEIR